MQPTVRDRIKVNNELKKLGFGGLEDPTLVKQIAFCIRTHEAFRAILMGCDLEHRNKAYHALAPNITHFTPKPLDVYERETHDRAEREQWDIWDGTAYPKPFKVGEVETEEYKLARQAEEALKQTEHEQAGGSLEMVCSKCTVAEYFPAPKRRDAVKKAHDAGWRWDERNGVKRQYCAKHVPGRCSMTLTCAAIVDQASGELCGRKERLRVWDEQDGYAAARRLGWVIGDVAKCPECALQPVMDVVN